jgi:hypothetical protein
MPLKRKPRIDEGAADRLGVFFRDAVGAHCVVPCGFHLSLHVVDHPLGFRSVEQEPRVLRKNIFRIGIAALIAAIEGEIAALLAHLR